VVRWATVIKDSDGRQIVIYGTSTGESGEVVVTVSELGFPTGEVVLVDDGTAVTITLNLDGRSIVILASSGNDSIEIVLTNCEIGRPSLEVTMLEKSSRAWLWEMVGWATVREDFDRGSLVILGASGVPSTHVMVSWSELSGPTGEVTMLVDDGTALIVTSDLDG